MGGTEYGFRGEALLSRFFVIFLMEVIRVMLSVIMRLVLPVGIVLLGGVVIHPLQKYVLRQEESLALLPLVFTSDDAPVIQRLEQQLSFVSLGGLRSLVAAFLSVNSYSYFEVRDWINLENRYRQIISLAPHNTYYWDMGAWHLAYNASADSAENKSLRLTERQIRAKNYIEKGKNFLRQGIKLNPKEWVLYARLGNLLSDPGKRPEYEEAAKIYQQAVHLGAPQYYERSILYCLARVPGKEKEALALCRELYENPDNRQPAVKTLFLALQIQLNVPRAERMPLNKLYINPKSAYWSIANYYHRDMGYSKEGIEPLLNHLKLYKNSTSWKEIPLSDLESW